MKKYLIFLFVLIFISGCSISKQNKSNVVTSYEVKYDTPKIKQEKKEHISIENNLSVFDTNVSIQEENITTPVIDGSKIALIIPSMQIGKYSQEAVNTMNSYLIYKQKNYNLKVYDIVVQSNSSIEETIKKIKEDNITKVIALFTPEFLEKYENTQIFDSLNIYFPIVNKHDTKLNENYNSDNLVFGGISYKKQIDILLKDKNHDKLVELYDDSVVGEKLHQFTSDYKLNYSKKVDNNNRAYKSFLKDRRLRGSVLVLNTPIIKSSILLSQIRSLHIKLDSVISTQLNFTPLILSLTQKEDRKNITMINSIGEIPKDLKEINSILDNSLDYSWVNYSIIVGLEYLTNDKNLFGDLEILNNQIEYPLYKYKVRQNSFLILK